MKDLSQLAMYDGAVATLSYGEKRTFRGVSNGPISMVVDGVLYAYSHGGDFAFEIVAPHQPCEVHFEAPKGVRMSLAKNPGATWIQGSPDTSWTKDEPRPAVNPQMAALQHSIKARESRLAALAATAAKAAAAAPVTTPAATTPAEDPEAAPEAAPDASEG
jgi:hypothetical protein